jgi:hypothetical protein
MKMQQLMQAAAVAVVILSAQALSAEDKPAEVSYFPVKVDTTWHYKAADGTPFVVKITDSKKVGNETELRLETRKADKVIASELLRVAADGVYRLEIEFTDSNKTVKETIQPRLCLLRLPPKKGESFTVDSKVNGKVYKGTFKISEEDVKVAAGEFKKAIKVFGVDLEAEGVRPTMTTWFAENVGRVKLIVAAGDSRIEWELEKFEPGQK